MSKEFLEAIFGAPKRRLDLTTGLKFLQCQAHGSVVFGREILEGLNDLHILTLRKQELGSLPQPDNGNSQDAHDKYKRSIAEPDVPPTLVNYQRVL